MLSTKTGRATNNDRSGVVHCIFFRKTSDKDNEGITSKTEELMTYQTQDGEMTQTEGHVATKCGSIMQAALPEGNRNGRMMKNVYSIDRKILAREQKRCKRDPLQLPYDIVLKYQSIQGVRRWNHPSSKHEVFRARSG